MSPSYDDQVPRMQAYVAAHPNVSIVFERGLWHARIKQGLGRRTFTRVLLKDLLDKLSSED